MTAFVSDWYRTAKSATISDEMLSLIVKHRRLMLIHCYLYYGLDTNLISDHKWMKLAQALELLQSNEGWEIGYYDDLFKDWDGSTGFHLITNTGVDPNVVAVAQRLVTYASKC